MKLACKLINTIIILISLAVNAISNCQADVYLETFECIKNKDYKCASYKAKESGNSELKKIVFIESIKNQSSSVSSFEKIVEFINENKDWPYIDDLKKIAEKNINDETDLRLVYKWFRENKPTSAKGYKYYVMSYLRYSKNYTITKRIIKEAWINAKFSEKDQKNFLTIYSSYLDQKDHRKKIENLLSDNLTSYASQILYLITDQKLKKSFNIQMELIKSCNDKADNIIRNLNNNEITNGIALTYLGIKRKAKVEIDDKILKLILKNYELDEDFEKKWWDVRSYFARELIADNSYSQAIDVLERMKIKNDVTIKYQLNFLLGFLNLKEHSHSKSTEYFKNCLEIAQRPRTKAKANYWIARSLLKNKEEKNLAKEYFLKASEYNYTFYGQLSLLELNQNKLDLNVEEVSRADIEKIKKHELAIATKLLTKYGNVYTARDYAAKFVESLGSSKDITAAIKYIDSLGNIHVTGWAARSAINKSVFVFEAYKDIVKIKNPILEESIIHSIIRQESTFDKMAYSGIDDRGLMQISPGAASDSSRSLGIKHDPKKLWEPHYNILIGSQHLLDRINYFNGSYVLGIPSYNCGQGNMNKAIRKFGDPRGIKELHKMVDWVESIPIQISRHYLQNVLESTQIYRIILTKNNELRLKHDLLKKH